MTLRHTLSLRALVSTIEPVDGGVPTMTRWICDLLVDRGITPVLAWYAPWRNYPKLSIPFYRILRCAKPKSIQSFAFEKYESHGIGAWMPELEFTHYLPSKMWKFLINNCHLHLAVSGNALSALPYLQPKIPFLAWIATPWEADRKDRIRELGIPRKILDTTINTPVLRKLERGILNASHGQILSLSRYTLRELNYLGNGRLKDVMYMPVDTYLFRPNYSLTTKWRIGFSGRYCDPRKNIELLLGAIRILLNQGHKVELILVGERKAEQLSPLIREYGLKDNASCLMHMSPNDLAQTLQTFDVFAIPSHQEGLCIAALEAMACGVPIVSTRCGGPEDYVKPGVTGELVENDVEEFALVIKNLCINRERRHQLSVAAVEWIERNASKDVSRRVFWTHLSDYAERNGYKIN
jgi:glycosyltransferase involved in cell wall biosynthesis